jgi:hypothetical protein
MQNADQDGTIPRRQACDLPEGVKWTKIEIYFVLGNASDIHDVIEGMVVDKCSCIFWW